MGDGDAQHKEAVSDFAMSETEVTNGQMLAYFASAKISAPEDYEAAFQKLLKSGTLKEAAHHPAVGIPYAIAEGFAKWAGARLPTGAVLSLSGM